MRHDHRVRRTLVLLAILAALSSCAHAREVVEGSGTPTSYLLCERTGAVPDPLQFRVGTLGGRLTMGANELLIPPGALMREAVITLSEVPGDTVGVRIDGPEFTLPVQLTVSTARCGGDIGTGWAVWRFRQGEPADRLRTRIDRNRSVAITHFRLHSGFIIAGRDRT